MDRNIREEVNSYKKLREARIMRRAKMYIEGDIDLEGFYDLERIEQYDDRANIDRKETAARLQELNEEENAQAEAPTKEAKAEAKKAALKKTAPYPPELDTMTADEYRKLSIAEMTRLYELAPERVREILNRDDRPGYMRILEPKPRDYKATTAEEFKHMTIYELSRLYEADPELYSQLRAESEGGGK